MKIRPLPDLDIARCAQLARDQKHRELEHQNLSRPPHKYHPVRLHILDILNAVPGFIPASPRTPWPIIADGIRRVSDSVREAEVNLQVARGLYNYAEKLDLSGRHWNFMPLNLGLAHSVAYWSPIVLAMEGRPVVPFINPRRTKSLTAKGRQFVFSAMHQRIRVLYPELATARLMICQFGSEQTGPRTAIPYFDDGIEMLSLETLNEMVNEVFEVWHEVLAGRAAEARRAGGGSGTLL